MCAMLKIREKWLKCGLIDKVHLNGPPRKVAKLVPKAKRKSPENDITSNYNLYNLEKRRVYYLVFRSRHNLNGVILKIIQRVLVWSLWGEGHLSELYQLDCNLTFFSNFALLLIK